MIYRIEANKPNPLGRTVVTKFIHKTGIGNQMSEFSAGLSVARTLGIDFEWVWKDNDFRDFGLEYFGIGKPPWWNVPVIAHSLGQGSAETIKKATELVASVSDKKVGICSPFQSEACFANVADEIRSLFVLEPLELDVPDGYTPVGMQVRRGDYIHHPRLDVCGYSYFIKAIKEMRTRVKNPWFFIISDDPAWCRDELGVLPNVTVMPDQSPIDGLRTMAACKAHIISNSSYGWWGAWLAESGPVIAPDPWFKSPHGYGDWNPVPDRWIRVKAGSQYTPKPEPLTPTPPPQFERAIVYPWKSSKATWQELRYSLRSIEKFFDDKTCPIIIFGTETPPFLMNQRGRLHFYDAWTYADCIVRGTQIAKKILWMNDDIILAKKCGWEDFETPRYSGLFTHDNAKEFYTKEKNQWIKGLGRAVIDLHAQGITDVRNFSMHLPYVYEHDKAMEVFKFYGVWEKIPMETLYYNHHGVEAERLEGFRTAELPAGNATVLSFNDRQLTDELKTRIIELLPEPAPYEYPCKSTLQSLH